MAAAASGGSGGGGSGDSSGGGGGGGGNGGEWDDFAVLRQEERIREEIAANRELIDAQRRPVASLLDELGGNPRFAKKIGELAVKYSELRRVRNDGNCFYRAYFFGTLVWLAQAREGDARRVALVKGLAESKERLVAAGKPALVIEDFWELVMELVTWARDRRPSENEIRARLADEGVANYTVAYARQLTAVHITARAELFAAYLPAGTTLQAFLREEVEPMGKECDALQCAALAAEVGLPVRIEYLDQSEGPLNHHDFPEDQAPAVFLLYRPGHYDVLYPKP
jgi:ubiquitin thioesterase protein OTUB1